MSSGGVRIRPAIKRHLYTEGAWGVRNTLHALCFFAAASDFNAPNLPGLALFLREKPG